MAFRSAKRNYPQNETIWLRRSAISIIQAMLVLSRMIYIEVETHARNDENRSPPKVEKTCVENLKTIDSP